MKNFSNKVVVITGAGSGMGRAYAQEFAKLGAQLALNDFDAKTLAETVALLKDNPAQKICSKAFDVSDREAMYGFASEVKSELGNAHVLINNAGIGGDGKPVWHVDDDEFDRTMQINFNGVYNGCRAFLPQLIENDEAALVNISSIFGLVGTPGTSAYCASKFAVRGFTESLMVELQDSSVSVHLVHPGGIRTNIAGDTEVGQEFAAKFLTTPPEAVAKKVIQTIRSGKRRLVYGNQAFQTWLISWCLPLESRNKILHLQLSKILDQNDYKELKRQQQRPKPWWAIAAAAAFAVLLAQQFSA